VNHADRRRIRHPRQASAQAGQILIRHVGHSRPV
jgi:hypothetical protein